MAHHVAGGCARHCQCRRSERMADDLAAEDATLARGDPKALFLRQEEKIIDLSDIQMGLLVFTQGPVQRKQARGRTRCSQTRIYQSLSNQIPPLADPPPWTTLEHHHNLMPPPGLTHEVSTHMNDRST